MPAAMAGVIRSVWWRRTKLYQPKCRQYAAQRFSHFFENAFVNRVRRRMHMRIVRFWRSTWLVQIFAGSGRVLRTAAGVEIAVETGIIAARNVQPELVSY